MRQRRWTKMSASFLGRLCSVEMYPGGLFDWLMEIDLLQTDAQTEQIRWDTDSYWDRGIETLSLIYNGSNPKEGKWRKMKKKRDYEWEMEKERSRTSSSRKRKMSIMKEIIVQTKPVCVLNLQGITASRHKLQIAYSAPKTYWKCLDCNLQLQQL